MSTTPNTTRTTDGLATIGRTKHALMGIRYADGEGGDTAAASAAAAQAIADKATADAAAAAELNAPWTKENFDPERAGRLVENLRGDLEKQRLKFETDLKEATTAASAQAAKDAVAGIAKLLSGQEEPETDPVKLAAKVTELGSKVAEQDTTLTAAQADIKARDIYLAAATIGAGQANLKLLLANEEFKTSIASVEPTDEAAIQAKITAALQANPALKATPRSSGSDGHQGGQTADLRTQLAAAEKANDRSLVISLKRRLAASAT